MHTIGSQAGRQRPASRPRRPDRFFVALSRAADRSVLWIVVSVLLAAGGRRARIGATRVARIATREDIRDRLGRLTYLLAAARALRKRHPFTGELRYGGRNERLTLAQLSVINAPRFGGPLRLSVPASDPDDRLLDILTVQDVPPSRMLAAVLPVLLHSGRPVPGIMIRHAARVAVSSGEPLEVTLDGEIAGTLPGSFEVAGNALRVITPLSFVDKDDDIATGRTR